MIVQLREAKARLSELIQNVAEGEEVVITRHGKSVAKLVRVERPSRPFVVNRKLLAMTKKSQKSLTAEQIIREDRDSRD